LRLAFGFHEAAFRSSEAFDGVFGGRLSLADLRGLTKRLDVPGVGVRTDSLELTRTGRGTLLRAQFVEIRRLVVIVCVPQRVDAAMQPCQFVGVLAG
jgi:hypothetical protein